MRDGWRRRCGLAVLALTAATVSARAEPLALFAAPGGRGTECTEASPCDLLAAQARAASGSANGDVVISLAAGTYVLAKTWTFSAADSGHGGHRVVYQAARYGQPDQARVTISGGDRLQAAWQRAAALPGGLAVYKARVPAGTDTRQLYVNGVRAQRATSVRPPADMRRTPDGYDTAEPDIARWHNPGDIDFVFSGLIADPEEIAAPEPFTEAICGIDRVARDNDVTHIALHHRCNAIASTFNRTRAFAEARFHDLGRVSRIENAYELLALPGQWYLDRAGTVDGSGQRTLYYVPRDGEPMDVAEIVIPRLERLVAGEGSAAAPIRDITFRGLTFAYATWLEPSREGVVVEQGNRFFLDLPGTFGHTKYGYPLGNVTLTGSRGLSFERDTFIHLGGDGLVLDGAAQGNRVEGSVFTDISGSGVRLGDYEHPEAAAGATGAGAQNVPSRDPSPIVLVAAEPAPALTKTPSERVSDNVFANNLFHDLPVEYRSGSALWTGYSERTTVAHNTVYNTPYTGVSAGYGFGDPSYQSEFRFIDNHIANYMRVLYDGGALYTNNRQGPSFELGAFVERNWVHDEGHPYNAIYDDEFGRYITIRHNVLYNNFHDWGGCESIGNFVFSDNFWQTGRPDLGCKPTTEPVTMERNTLIARGAADCALLAACRAITRTAGIEPAFADIQGRGWSGATVPIEAGRPLRYTGTEIRIFGEGTATVAICEADGEDCEPGEAATADPVTGLLYASVPRILGEHSVRVAAAGPLRLDHADILTRPEDVDDKDEGGSAGRIAYAHPYAWTRRGDETTRSAFGGSANIGDGPEATATLRFFGTGVRLYGLQRPNNGIGEVAIDGAAAVPVDFFGFERVGDAALWTSPDLPRGLHTMTLRWTGRRNALASGSAIALDRAEVFP